MLLLEYNQCWCGKSNSSSHWVASYNLIVDELPVTAHSIVFYSLGVVAGKEEISRRKNNEIVKYLAFQYATCL